MQIASELFLCFFYSLFIFLVVSVNRVVDGVVETTALFTLDSHTGDEITHVDHVAELAELLAHLDTLEEILGLFVKKVEAVPGTLQAKVAAHDAHVVAHAFAHLLDALGNQYLLLVGQGTLVVPGRNLPDDYHLAGFSLRGNGQCQQWLQEQDLREVCQLA